MLRVALQILQMIYSIDVRPVSSQTHTAEDGNHLHYSLQYVISTTQALCATWPISCAMTVLSLHRSQYLWSQLVLHTKTQVLPLSHNVTVSSALTKVLFQSYLIFFPRIPRLESSDHSFCIGAQLVFITVLSTSSTQSAHATCSAHVMLSRT